jgi:hypothetical protein
MDNTQRVFKASQDLRAAYQWHDHDGQLNDRLIGHQRSELKLALERWDEERIGQPGRNPVIKSDSSPQPYNAAKASRLEVTDLMGVLKRVPACGCGSTDGYHRSDCARWEHDASHVDSHESMGAQAIRHFQASRRFYDQDTESRLRSLEPAPPRRPSCGTPLADLIGVD